MSAWREKYLEAFTAATSDGDVFRVLAGAVQELGFEHCSFGVRMPLPINNQQFAFKSDYAEAWAERYVSQNYFAVDPTVTHGLTQSIPLTWQASSQTRSTEFWEEASHHGLRHGWCMPVRSHVGTIGLVSMVRSAEAIKQTELADKEFRMSWLVNAANGVMIPHLLAGLMPEYSVELTPREREALRWSAAGKTYSEIGKIMCVDERTVKFHLVNTMRKLNATNKTEAAVKAAMLGLLF